MSLLHKGDGSFEVGVSCLWIFSFYNLIKQ